MPRIDKEWPKYAVCYVNIRHMPRGKGRFGREIHVGYWFFVLVLASVRYFGYFPIVFEAYSWFLRARKVEYVVGSYDIRHLAWWDSLLNS